MDAAQALADLTEISSQVEQVAIVDTDGSLLASTARDSARAERFASAIARLLEEADSLAKSRGLSELTQLEISTLDGSVFIVRRDGRMVAATTRADPTVGLIFYDLKHCLSSMDPPSGDTAETPADEAAPVATAQVEPAPAEAAPAEPEVVDSAPSAPAEKAEAPPARRSAASRTPVDETLFHETFVEVPDQEVPIDEAEAPAQAAPTDEAPIDETKAVEPAPSVSEYTTFIAPRVEPPAPTDDDEATAEDVAVDAAAEATDESATNGKRDEPTGRTPRKKADTSA